MTFQQKTRFWLIALAATAATLWLLSGIMLPFVVGMALAYLLDPVADRLEQMGLPRLVATLLILLVFTLVFVVAIVALVPVLASQLEALIRNFPQYVERLQTLFNQWSPGWLGDLLQSGTGELEGNIGSFLKDIAGWLGTVTQSLLSGGLAIVNVLALMVVTPVVAFYMLVDWDRMIERIDALLPRDHKQTIRTIMGEIDDAVAGFIRGQTLVCFILGAFYAVGLSLLGLNFGLLIGLGAGLISFIPYVGSLSGFLVAVGVALVQFWPDWTLVVAVAGVFVAGQTIEGNFLQPKLVGSQVGLHPVWLMFALFAFGYLFGFVGLLLAVPVAAAIGVLVRFGIGQYKASPIYRGMGGSDGAA